jgi:hypothetical protein
MKSFPGYNLLLWLITLSIVWLTACSDEIRVIHPGSPVPVIFGVLDLNQPVHHIKLSKSFAGTRDPYTLALDREVIFYSDPQVFLTEANGSGRMFFKADKSIPRLDGLFPSFPNEVYTLNQKLNPGDYRLTVILPPAGDTLTATFTFLSNFRVIIPKTGFKRFYFYEDPVLFSWLPNPAAGLYEINLLLTWEEWMKTGESKSCSVNFSRQLHIADLELEEGRYTYRFYSESFFASLGTSIRQDPAVDYRKPTGLELLITAADTTLARYLDWYNLEIDDKVNPNGNIKGAIGVVGTKFSVPFTGLILSPRSQDSLVRGRYTRKLGFVNNPDW